MASTRRATDIQGSTDEQDPHLVLGVLLVIIGVVWFFQGIGSLAGSPMTGVSFWAFAGVLVLLVGAFLVLRGLRGRRGSTPQ